MQATAPFLLAYASTADGEEYLLTGKIKTHLKCMSTEK